MRKRRAPDGIGLRGTRMAMDAQHVVLQRLTRFALGTPDASREASLMVTEKVQALADSQRLMAAAMAQGKPEKGVRQVVDLYERKVRANRKRLSKYF